MSLQRFKGAMVGAVVADCIGSEFEGRAVVKTADILRMYSKLKSWRQEQREKGTRPADVYGVSFTDDTAMARSIMYSLIDRKGFDAHDLASRFTMEFFKEPDRGYGGSVVTVFEALKNPQLTDVYQPAKEQFNGSGSYGNGGAMRVVPAPLFLFKNNDILELERLASSITRLTHTHPHAIHGALLQAFAVDLSLRISNTSEIDADCFCDELIKRLKPIEERSCETEASRPPSSKKKSIERELDGHPHPYCAKLEKVKEFVRSKDLPARTVEKVLGNDVSALGSVPAAVLSFLRGSKMGVQEIEEENPFKRVVTYAISLGGDTDTIGTMAAAMAGAFYGMDKIPEEWLYYCEGVADADTAAEELYKLNQ